MTDGVTYEDLFVVMGWYPKIYKLKMAILVLFMLTMSIVVNNALIGLAVGDANEVMESASVDKFRRRVRKTFSKYYDRFYPQFIRFCYYKQLLAAKNIHFYSFSKCSFSSPEISNMRVLKG